MDGPVFGEQIKRGVTDGQEGIQTGANHQQAA